MHPITSGIEAHLRYADRMLEAAARRRHRPPSPSAASAVRSVPAEIGAEDVEPLEPVRSPAPVH